MTVEGTDVGIALYCLLGAAVCYRLCQENELSKNRCEQAALIIDDIRSYGVKYDAQIGLLHEFQGDFAVVAQMDSTDESYERALEYYRDYNSPGGWQSEPAFDWNFAFLARMADSADHTISDEEMVHSYLVNRIEYKQTYFAEIVADVYESGGWQYEKGI